MSETTIDLDDEVDRWRWACPAGHRNWEATNGHFWCAECARTYSDDLEPEFEELRNLVTGDIVHRDDLQLLTQVGPYETLYGGSA
ncbi:hypothetical protein [Natronosalvus rutilus]|uniref:Uncharacterized protein n=1 Tax=Natronosalvus rutilus TaxID=2953753 RepID=A0A9E7SSQ0_9EURY|nr:hypothetical protein [Natronosalvus rutilus]UTF52809.1 hypothetical protein NGM29_13605 [Natronosalvus rutilus]